MPICKTDIWGKTMLKRYLSFLVVSLWIFCIGCSSETTTNTEQLQVTTTTGMIADIVKQVGGKHVEVTALMGPGVDPHLYKASAGDINKLEQADIIFYNGLYLEGKMTDILQQIAKKKTVIAVAEQIDKKKLIATGANQYDPHIWFDVSLWMEAVKQVEQGLSKADPTHQQDYQKQAQQYLDQLQALDREIKEQIQTIPKEQRILVTAHDAFGYFGRAYDIQVVGLQGLSTASEYGLKDVQRLVNLIVQKKIKAVFIESSVPKKSIEAVVNGAKAKNWQVNIGGELYSDALGGPGSEADTYIKMVRANVDTIVSSLR